MSETAQDAQDRQDAQEEMMLTPDPALSRLDRFVGTWSMEGQGSEGDGARLPDFP